MKLFYRFAAIVPAFLLICTSLSAQSAADLIREDPDRAGGVYHSFEFHPIYDSPVPKGYKPFYISHYGRHGSRHHIGTTFPYEYMRLADSAGILTPLGKELFADVTKIYEDHIGMDGELSVRGGREHRMIAERMYGRFSDVFKNKKRYMVHAQSSYIPRCLISMANFTSSLDDQAPHLKFTFVTGKKYIELLAHDYYNGREINRAGGVLRDSLLNVHCNPGDFMRRIFSCSDEEAERITGADAKHIMRAAFLYGGICQDLDYLGVDIFGKYFTVDELIDQYIAHNSNTYNNMSNSLEFGDRITWAARGLLRDITEKADAALAGGSDVAADLRFGHDTGILPLAGLMQIQGPGDRWHNYEVTDHWQSFQNVPMGSNMQIVFFRNKKDDVIVKILYNEKERFLPAEIKPVSGPFYKWSDVRAWFEKLYSDTSIPE